MVRTRIPQRAVTQQPRQKGNVAPWTGDLCLSGSGGFGSSRKAPCGSVQALLVIRSRAPNRRINGLGIRSNEKAPASQSCRGLPKRTQRGARGLHTGPHPANGLARQTFHAPSADAQVYRGRLGLVERRAVRACYCAMPARRMGSAAAFLRAHGETATPFTGAAIGSRPKRQVAAPARLCAAMLLAAALGGAEILRPQVPGKRCCSRRRAVRSAHCLSP
jgi:hypothetical protein